MNFIWRSTIKRLKIHSNLLCILLLFMVNGLHAQQSDAEVDFLLEKAESENLSNNYNKSILYSTKAYTYSKVMVYENGIVTSLYELALSNYYLGRYKDSFRFLTNISDNYASYLEKNDALNLKFIELTGKVYLWQGLKMPAKKEFIKQLKLASQINNVEARNLNELKAYSLLGISPELDSAHYYLKRALSYQSKIKDSSEFILPYVNLTRYYYTINDDLDSAIYYNDLAARIAKKINSKHLFVILLQKGKIASFQNKPEVSLENSFKALELAKKNKRGSEMVVAYKLISDMYGEMKRYEDQVHYLSLYTETKDSISNELNTTLLTYIEAIHNDKNLDNLIDTKRTNYMYATIVLLLLILGYAIYKMLKYKRRNSKEEILFQEKEKEVETLRDILKNDQSEDLLLIAQHKPSEFPQKFSEIYADFVKKLLEIEPNLVATEITFCAYLRLKFSTKDIASIMYVTPKAIQNRKNRIRKKLNIPSDEDIYVWFNKL